MSKLITAVAAALCIAALAPAAASAISMKYENGHISVAAAPGEMNYVFAYTTKASNGRRWLHVREQRGAGHGDPMDAGKLIVRYDERYCKIAYNAGEKRGISCHTAAVLDVTIATGDEPDRIVSWAPAIPFRIYGGAGGDVIEGGHGNDKLWGGSGSDEISGDSDGCCSRTHYGADDTPAGMGADEIDGGPGIDVIHGDRGNDWIAGGPDSDWMYGGTGSDVLNYSSSPQPVKVSLWVGPNDPIGAWGERDKTPETDFEGVIGSAYADELGGGPRHDLMLGGAGDDKIDGRSNNDTLAGQDGNDLILAGQGHDYITAGAGNDRVEADDDWSDIVRCDDGYDTALVDKELDNVSSCEQDWSSWPGS